MESMVRVSLGGESREVPESRWQEAADELHAKHGGGIPDVRRIEATPSTVSTEPAPPSSTTPVIEVPKYAVPPTELTMVPGAVTPPGRPPSRSCRAAAHLSRRPRPRPRRARACGSATSTPRARPAARPTTTRRCAPASRPRSPIYERGTEVNGTGVENARRFRAEWARSPVVADYCADLIARVAAEDRKDELLPLVTGLRMRTDGTVTIKRGDGQGPEHHAMTERGLEGLAARLECYGAKYLGNCWPELRAHNVNQWIDARAREHACRIAASIDAGKPMPEPKACTVRTRKAPKVVEGAEQLAREIYGVVGPNYTAFDVDKIAEALKLAAPADARGRVSYDGHRARFEVLWASTVEPEAYVAGEFFRAGVVIWTDDAGGGAIRGGGTIWQNLCLNLIMIDRATSANFWIRHTGNVEQVAAEFRAGFARSLESVEHFRKAWGYAVEDRSLAKQAEAATGEDVPVSSHELMSGIFLSLLQRELVKVPGVRAPAVHTGLMEAWEGDKSAAAGVSRAAVVNAITRYAHAGAHELDPWAQDEVSRQGAALLFGRGKAKPAPLLWAAEEAK